MKNLERRTKFVIENRHRSTRKQKKSQMNLAQNEKPQEQKIIFEISSRVNQSFIEYEQSYDNYYFSGLGTKANRVYSMC